MANLDLDVLARLPMWEWPEEARETILAGLSEPEDRELAVELAAEIAGHEEQVAAALLDVVEDDEAPPELRAGAAIALGPGLEEYSNELGFDLGIGEPDTWSKALFDAVTATLRRLVDDEAAPTLLRRRALEASVRAPQPWLADAVRAALERPGPEWRMTAIFAARWVPGFEDAIREALGATHPEVLAQALLAAGAREMREAGAVALRLARSPETELELRLAAVAALATVDARGAEELLLTLSEHEDGELSDVARDALMQRRLVSGELEDEL